MDSTLFYHHLTGIFDSLAVIYFFNGMHRFLIIIGVFLGGTWTGICSVLQANTWSLTLIGHHLTSYPEMTLCFVVQRQQPSPYMDQRYGDIVGGCGIKDALFRCSRFCFGHCQCFGILAYVVWIFQKRTSKGLVLMTVGIIRLFIRGLGSLLLFHKPWFEEQVTPVLCSIVSGSASGYQPAYSSESRWSMGT